MCIPLTDHDDMAVGSRPGNASRADRASRSRDVFNEDWLAERILHPGRDDAGERVGWATRCEWYDDRDRSGRILLRQDPLDRLGSTTDRKRKRSDSYHPSAPGLLRLCISQENTCQLPPL